MTVFKLHNDFMQRGLPDYLMWSRNVPITAVELKVASSLAEALAALSDGQASVLRSQAMSPTGAVIAFGDGEVVGAARIKGAWNTALKIVIEHAEHPLATRFDGCVKAVRTKKECGDVLALSVLSPLEIAVPFEMARDAEVLEP